MQQAHAQPVLRQLPLPRRAGAQEDAVRGRGVVEHGVALLLDILRRPLRVNLRLSGPMAPLRVGAHVVLGPTMILVDSEITHANVGR